MISIMYALKAYILKYYCESAFDAACQPAAKKLNSDPLNLVPGKSFTSLHKAQQVYFFSKVEEEVVAI